ncbi:MAG: cyclic nucleotide-binding domain-containing protein [Hyphomicrobiaceae bacterium]
MAIDQLSAHLLRLEIFQDLPPLHITEIVRRAERVVYKPGQALITEGEPGEAAIIPISGEAVRTAGPALADAADEEQIEPGSLLGEMTMLIDTDYSSTVIARTPVKALRIARADLLDMMQGDPALADHFVQKVSSRLRRLLVELRDMTSYGFGDDEETGEDASDEPDPPTDRLITHDANAATTAH